MTHISMALAAAGLACTMLAVPIGAQRVTATTRTTTVHRETGVRRPVVIVRHDRHRVCTVHMRHGHRVRTCAIR